MKLCGQCHMAVYCSHYCQKKDWTPHRLHCQPSSSMVAFKKKDIPPEWRSDTDIPAGVVSRCRQLGVLPLHVQSWHVAVSVPGHPLLANYLRWHSGQEGDDIVPLLIENVCSYSNHALIQTTRHSLNVNGRPPPAWVGIVKPKELNIQVHRLNGASLFIKKMKYSETVSTLKQRVEKWMAQDDGFSLMKTITKDGELVNFDFDLLYDTTILQAHNTLSEAGLTTCSDITIACYEDPLPPLLSYSDSHPS